MKSRRFAYDGSKSGKPSFEVTTNLTDDEAIALLDPNTAVGFREKCFFEIEKLKRGYRTSPNLLAWAFKMAEDARTQETLKVSCDLLAKVKFRRPMRGVTPEGDAYEIKLAGNASKYAGQYLVTDGERFPGNKFYGTIKPDGTWQPSKKCPASIKLALR